MVVKIFSNKESLLATPETSLGNALIIAIRSTGRTPADIIFLQENLAIHEDRM